MVWNFFLSFENLLDGSLNVELESKYSEYMKLTMNLLFASGLSFLFPILLIALAKLKILSVNQLKKNRKFFALGIIIFSAIVTPPDLISQIGIAIPLLIFYEISIIFFAGSTPSTDILHFLKPSNNTPILLPTSTTKSLLFKLNLDTTEFAKL